MNFIVNGYDFTDEKALERRMQARDAHMANIQIMREKGRILFAVAKLNENGDMCGSTMILEMASREEVDSYLSMEPYIEKKVWDKVEVIPCAVPPLFK